MTDARSTRRGPLALATGLALLTVGLPFATADVPTVPEPVTYDKFQAILDPGLGAADYFQPYWFDTDGRHIQAHGGQIVQSSDEQGPVYYWYGEDRSNGYYDSPGVSGYVSRDGYNWENMGVVLKSVTTRAELTNDYFDAVYDTVDELGNERTELVDDLFYHLNVNPVAPDGSQQLSAIFERPKVLYNDADDTWVMWWHSDGKIVPGGSNYARSLAAVAVADNPEGPFKLVGSYRMYNREAYRDCISAAVPGQARDMTVFKDDDGTAWIVYSSEENRSLYMARLNEHYTNVEKTSSVDTQGLQYSADGQYPYLFADGTPEAPVRGEDFQIVRECGSLESPAVYKFDGRYFVVTSGTTGWAPNQNTYYSADDILGDWIRGVDPSDPYEHVGYQNIPEGGDGRISVGDFRKTTFGSQSTDVFALDASQGKFIYLGDRWNEGKADSTYVWLPITIAENGRMEMRNPATEDPARWGDGWDESYWDDKGAGPHIWNVTDTRLPLYFQRGDLDGLPTTVAVTAGGATTDVGVTWDTTELATPGMRTIVGTLAAGGGFGPGRTFTREVQVVDGLLRNIAPEASVAASSRQSLAGLTNDGDLKAKGWDDWVSGGAHPLNSSLAYTWSTPRTVDSLTVHTYHDGGATWPGTITIEYQDDTGAWVPTGVSATLEQNPNAPAPTVTLALPELPKTTGIRVVMTTEISTWQAISEVEIFGESELADCGPVLPPWRTAAWGVASRSTFCQGLDGSLRVGDNNSGAWTTSDALAVASQADALEVGDAIETTISEVDPGGNSDPRAGLVLRNDLTVAGRGNADGYALLVASPTGVMMQYDDNGNGYIDTETDKITDAVWPLQLKLEYTDAGEATGFWRATSEDEWQVVATVPLTDAATKLDAGVFVAGNNQLGMATATFVDTAVVTPDEPAPDPDPSPSPDPSETPDPSPSPDPSETPDPSPSPEPEPTVTVTEVVHQPSDVHTTPGFHTVNGRWWHTKCEPYSQTVRCRTEIWGTQVNLVGGRYVQTNGWTFNNLTYLPMLTREQWAHNPLGYSGQWTAADGRQWRTECDTAVSGRNGCRSYIWSEVHAAKQVGGAWTYNTEQQWVFNNRVIFRAN